MKIITYLEAQAIIDIACDEWKDKLALQWSQNIVLRENVEITEEEYEFMRKACTREQHKLFDEIFGVHKKPQLPIKKGDLCMVCNMTYSTKILRYYHSKGQFVDDGDKDGPAVSRWNYAIKIDDIDRNKNLRDQIWLKISDFDVEK